MEVCCSLVYKALHESPTHTTQHLFRGLCNWRMDGSGREVREEKERGGERRKEERERKEKKLLLGGVT